MKLHMTLLVVVAAYAGSPGSLHAGMLLTPFAGASFGGSTDGTKGVYGGDLTFLGERDPLGLGVDFGYTPSFLGSTNVGKNNLVSLMGNLVFATPGTVRLYASAGLGLVRTNVQDVSGFFKEGDNELGIDVGGGLMLFSGSALGLRGDIRYFRNLTNPEPKQGLDVDLGGLSFWRATGGLVLRF